MDFMDFNWQELAKKAADEKTTLKVEIEGITPDQAKAFTRMFGWMNLLGGQGCSRRFTVSYDGDGGARARIKVNGKEVYPEKDDQEEQDHDAYDNLHFGFE